jgi:hypothetical protein
VEHPDGTTEIVDPSGRKTTVHPTEIKNPDGTTTVVYPYDGRKETTGFGSEDPRSKEVKYPDGRTETTYNDGHTKTTFPPGDERESETVSADGNVTTTKYRDGHTQTVDKTTGDTTINYPPRGNNPGSTVTIHKDGQIEVGPYQAPAPDAGQST